jgi:hypothetical protein
MAKGAKTSGWFRAAGNGSLELYYDGTRVGTITATNLGLPFATTLGLLATTTITAGTGVVVTTGNYTQSASGFHVTAGNARLGAVDTFLTTEPTSAVVFKEGTNPVGAIATSGGIFCTTAGATLSKIIAAGTVSQIEA